MDDPIEIRVFVVSSNRENYFDLLRPKGFIVDQAPWADLEACSFADSLVVRVRPQREPFANTPQNTFRSFSPHVVLLRSFVLGTPSHDHREAMKALFHSNVVCINSLDSFAWSIDKELAYGLLRRVQTACPSFPLVPQTYYSAVSVAGFCEFPCVVKIGSASQGVGKARAMDAKQFGDMTSLIAMQEAGFTTEPLVAWVSDIRVQKIGPHYRAIRRFRSASQPTDAWKANDAFGIGEEDVPVEERWKTWADACSAELHMDILGLDILQAEDGAEYVLECNSSSSGFPERHRAEDMGYVAELIVEKASVVRQQLRERRLLNALKRASALYLPTAERTRCLEILQQVLAGKLEAAAAAVRGGKALRGDNAEQSNCLQLLIWIESARAAHFTLPNGSAHERFVATSASAAVLKSLGSLSALDKHAVENATEMLRDVFGVLSKRAPEK